MDENLQPEKTDVRSISSSQKRDVIVRSEALIRSASDTLDTPFTRPEIRFRLTGQRAGLYAWRRNGECYIDYNPQVFTCDFDHHLRDTVAHEVAHHIAHQLYGHRIKPHGREWKQIARLLGATPRARGDYSLEGVAVRRQKRYHYRCQCRSWPISATRHNRVKKGAEYRCRECGVALTLVTNAL